jgi:small-conductance mechanosensitive channel
MQSESLWSKLAARAVQAFEQLGGSLFDAGLFLAAFAVLYLPGRFLVLPATRRFLDAAAVDPSYELPALKLLHAVIAVFAVFIAIAVSGVASYLQATQALAAAATLAVGFAAQDVLGNFVSGVFIVVDPTFNIGDWIAWKDKEGVIEDISFRVTRVHTFDNELISVPNSELTDNAVRNPVAKDRLRINVELGIGYEDDIERGRAAIVDVAAQHPEILDRPAPSVQVSDLAASYVGLTARFWIAHPARTDTIRIRSEFTQAIKERFDAEGIEMPYPYRQLTGSLDVRQRSASGPDEPS